MMFLVGAANGYSMQMGGAVRVSRAAMSKLAAPRMDITVEKSGEFGTTDYTMTFKDGDKVVSPWHDMPLELEGGMYNMLTEIPKVRERSSAIEHDRRPHVRALRHHTVAAHEQHLAADGRRLGERLAHPLRTRARPDPRLAREAP